MEQLTSNTNKTFSRKKYYLIYSGIFLFCSTLFILYLVLNGKTNINFKSDGMNQHYRAMIYYSRYLKEIVRNLFVNHKLVIPLWDFSIGEGADIINVLHSDAIGDPLTFLCVFVPEKFMPMFYMFNTFIRIYLAGIFFSELCFYTGQKKTNCVLAGTLTYIFGYWALQSITFHIYFLTPFMYLPLLILGVEKIINDDKPYVFVLAVLFGSISWLYYFYMEALATAIYGVIRVIFKYKTDFKMIISKLLYILIHAVLGIMMAMVVLMPMIMAYMGDSRMGVAGSAPTLYPWFFYERLFTIFVANDYPYDLCLGFVSPALLAIVVLLKNYKKHSMLLLFNILCAIFLIFPVFGKIWNGFAYVSQRWSFVVALPIAYNMVVAWDEFKENKKLLLISLPIIFCAAFFSAWARNERVIVPVIICFVFCFIAVLDSEDKVLRPKLRELLMFGLILLNVFYIYDYNLSSRGGDFINELLTYEQINNLTSSSEAYAIKQYTKNEKEFSRYTGNYLTNNASIFYDVHSTNFYWSITNPNDQKFRMDLGLKDRLSWQLIGYDDRAELESLANVKYYVQTDGYAGIVPFGFEYADTVNGYKIYKNDYLLPFGYTYDSSISYDDYEKLNMVEKQKAMMQSIIVDEPLLKSEYNKAEKEVEYNALCEDGIVFDNNKIVVNNDDSLLTLTFDKDPNCEVYVLFEGIDFEDTYNVIDNDSTTAWISINSLDGNKSNVIHMTKTHRYNFGKKNYVCYMGNNERSSEELKISFSLEGEYTYDKIRIVTCDMTKYKEYVDSLSKDCLMDVVFDTNRISGTINLDSSRYLLMSVPYSALYLQPGEHTIELSYMTPGLVVGALISVVGFVLFGMSIYEDKRREKNEINYII